jgi:hypothetical protein
VPAGLRANQKNRATTLACDPCATAPGYGVSSDALCGGEVTAGLLGGASGVSGDALCGGEATAGLLGGTNSKGRWVQALLTPAPQSEKVACLPRQGKQPSREKIDRDMGVLALNAKVELLNCREWLRRIRGEVDADLQRLDLFLMDMEFSRPGQERLGSEMAPKPLRKPVPNGKKPLIPKAPSVGLGLGPKMGKSLGQPKSLLVSSQNGPGVDLGDEVDSSGHPNGPPSAGCSVVFADHGLLLEAGLVGSLDVEPSRVVGASGLVVGRLDSGDARSVGSSTGLAEGRPYLGDARSVGSPARVGSPAKAPSLRFGMSGSNSCFVSSSERGNIRSARMSPA